MTPYLQLVPCSRKRGSIHPLLHTTSWRSSYSVKHRDNFIFTPKRQSTTELGSVADQFVFCSVITKPRMRAPHGAGWPMPPLCEKWGGGVAMAVYGTGEMLGAEGAKRNGSWGNEVNREEMKRRTLWYCRSRCGTHAGDFLEVVVSAVGCLMQGLAGISGLQSTSCGPIWMQRRLIWRADWEADLTLLRPLIATSLLTEAGKESVSSAQDTALSQDILT
jgi:hypothetical protein